MANQEIIREAGQPQVVIDRPLPQSANVSEIWLMANLAIRFFLGACIVFVVAETLTDIRHDSFSWIDLRSGLVVIAVTLLFSVLLGRVNGGR